MSDDYLEPYPSHVPANGTGSPAADQIEDLIKILVTIRSRYGNTAVKYRISWGGNAMWVEDAQKEEIRNLGAKVQRLKEQAARLKETIKRIGGLG